MASYFFRKHSIFYVQIVHQSFMPSYHRVPKIHVGEMLTHCC